jgi:hypothetical protein
MTAWNDYLVAAQRLDAVRREAASVVTAEAASVQATKEELATVRRRIDAQRTRLLDTAFRSGLVPPTLAATGPAHLDDDPTTTVATLDRACADLDAADALLAEADRPGIAAGLFGSRPPALRNLIVYGTFAIVVLLLQLILFVSLKDSAASIAATVAGAILPIIGFGLAWLGVGAMFREGGQVDRTPVLGAAVSAIPVVLLCAGFGVFALVR